MRAREAGRWVLGLVVGGLVSGCATSRHDVSPPGSTAVELRPHPLLPPSAALASFHLVEIQERRFSTEFTLTNRTQILRIEATPGLRREDAQTMAADGAMGVQALYANALSPYPGDISKEVISDPRFRPELIQTNWQGQSRTFVLLFANERLGYGATTPDAARHRSIVGWFHCEQSEILYKVRCFAPTTTRREVLEALFLSFTCPPP